LSLDDIYNSDEIESNQIDEFQFGMITEKDKFHAAKQILFGLAVLYVITLIAFIYKPAEGNRLLDVCTTTFPPLATLILAAYFRDRSN
jgi:hypothetical protein